MVSAVVGRPNGLGKRKTSSASKDAGVRREIKSHLSSSRPGGPA